jgi:hypothetical protein
MQGLKASTLRLYCPLWVKNGHGGFNLRCPLCPQKRTLEHTLRMSALGQKRTFTECSPIYPSAMGRGYAEPFQKARGGNFGFNTLRALSAPITGRPAGLSNPICTSTPA